MGVSTVLWSYCSMYCVLMCFWSLELWLCRMLYVCVCVCFHLNSSQNVFGHYCPLVVWISKCNDDGLFLSGKKKFFSFFFFWFFVFVFLKAQYVFCLAFFSSFIAFIFKSSFLSSFSYNNRHIFILLLKKKVHI